MPTIKLNSGRTFPCETGTSILDAASQAGIALPYSCRTGRCSTCKARVVDGISRALREETGLSEQERAAGWILGCVRTAQSDLVLEAQEVVGVDLAAPRIWPCRVHGLERLAHDVLRVILRLAPNADFRFRPGQYVDILAPSGIRRSYSLANCDFAENLLELHIREVPDGAMSEYWFRRAKVNDLLRLHGPLGTFFLRETAGADVYFLATGTGIAPIRSMLGSMAQLPAAERARSVTVLWGGRHLPDLYLQATELPACDRFVPVLSRAEASWTGARGHVQDVLLASGAELRGAVVYACGSDAMIHGARTALCGAGVRPDRFYSDAFVSSGLN